MNADLLRELVYSLSFRLSWLGIGSDIAGMTIWELEDLYRFLRRLADG